MNILVGPNNSGKSTLVSAFRVLSSAMRRANAKSAEPLSGPQGIVLGHRIPTDDLPMSLENVHTNYDESRPTTARFHFSSEKSLTLYFPPDGGAILIPERAGPPVRSPSDFRREFPFRIEAVPVLGPVEHKEEVVQQQTVQRGIATHRASRHFRNYWYHYPQDFDEFAKLISLTWSEMEIQAPEFNGDHLVMYCKEDRIDRELYWAGFGFQVRCQLMSHIVRSREVDFLVIDEPEIYLHPDLQRRLLAVLRDVQPDILLATHAFEIISNADHADILIIDKAKRSAQRLQQAAEVQSAMDILGSSQNMALTELARNRRLLFVEGVEDFKIISGFAQLLKLPELAARTGLTVIDAEGFTNAERVRAFSWGAKKVIDVDLVFAIVLDRDYRSDEEIESLRDTLQESVRLAHIHERKEIENYLLIPNV
jgi:hypothetical protein